MRNIKRILQMYLVGGMPMRKIADVTAIPYSTIYGNIALVEEKGLTWPQIEAMSEEALEEALFANDRQRPLPNWEHIETELTRPGVTLNLLWQEYIEIHPDGYRRSSFCKMYKRWCKKTDVYSPMPHKAGEELFVDYSGKKMTYICIETNHPMEAEIFVATLGASNRIYAEATRSQQLSCWIESNINAFEFNGGVTEMVVPDNLKSAVTTSDRYEPVINRSFEDFGDHYGTFIVPTRSRKPKDKSLVEESVQCVQREIIAPLRNITFFGIDSMNQAIQEKLQLLNGRPMQKKSGSRESRFEEIDKPVLKPLPATRYCIKEWFTMTVGQNHHIRLLGHDYSVPHKYSREKVDAAADTKIVEIFFRGEIIARHRRSFTVGGITTLLEHMPEKYRAYLDSYDKEKLLMKAKDIGPNAFAWAEEVLSLKGRPFKTLCNTVLGALALAKEFSKSRVDIICERALASQIYSYRKMRSMLVHRVDRFPLLHLPETTQSHLPQNHANVRGAEHFV